MNDYTFLPASTSFCQRTEKVSNSSLLHGASQTDTPEALQMAFKDVKMLLINLMLVKILILDSIVK
jgi:hypothetical protein